MRLLLAALALAASPALAVDLTNLSDAERETFRQEVRAYLLENPEVLMEAIAVLENRQAAAEASQDETLALTNADALFNDGHSWVGGNPEGDITIVEFMDYRCGYCRRAHPEVAELVRSDGNIRYIIKEFPILGEQSTLSARLAVAIQQIAGDETYKLASDTLIAQRSDLNEDSIADLSRTLGLDPQEVMTEMDSDRVTEILRENQLLGQRLQITGTPTFVFNSQMVRGYAPLQAMEGIVAEIRNDS